MEREYPSVIYRYLDWNNPYHQRVLSHNELFLASPDSFNDPFDCQIPKAMHLLNTDEKREAYLKRVAAPRIESGKLTINEFNMRKAKLMAKMKSDPNWLHNLSEQSVKNLHQGHSGVVCFSCEHSNILLWAHYAANHRGLCVGFSEDKLRNLNSFGKGGLVGYQVDFPVIDPLEDDRVKISFTQTHIKAKCWEYENEYRLMRTFDVENPTENERKVCIDDVVFVDITIGLKFPNSQLATILGFARKKRILMYRMVKVPLKFELRRVLIR